MAVRPISDFDELPEIRIDSRRRRSAQQWTDLRGSQELVLMLARREVQLRYRHSFAGIGWAVMQPLITLMVLSLFQTFLGGSQKGGVPYPLYAMTGLLLWTFVGHALTQASNSILKYTSVIKKVHFQLLILPVASVLGAWVDFVVALPLVAALMLYYGYWPKPVLLLLPVFVLLLVLFAMAAGIWLALLNTKYRDTSNALPFVMQLWFFLTPIAYNANQIPPHWRLLVGLNPLVGITEGIRLSLFGTAVSSWSLWLTCSCVITLVLLVSGVAVFLREEGTLAESI